MPRERWYSTVSNKSLVGSSERFQRKPKPQKVPSVINDDGSTHVAGGEVIEHGVTDAKRKIIVQQRLRGVSIARVAEVCKVTEEAVLRVEAEYYASRDSMPEHAMRAKQLDRLDALLDLLWDHVTGHAFDKDHDQISNALAVIKEISDLAGLKKQKIVSEIRLIEQQQVPLIVTFNDRVVHDVVARMRPHLTKKGQAVLDAHLDEWMSEAVSRAAGVLETTTETRSL